MQNNLMDKEINFESLFEYLGTRYHNREIEPDKEFGGLQLLLDELKYRNFGIIGEVHEALERTEKAFDLFETEVPPEGKEGRKYSPAGIARISMRLLGNNFFPYRKIFPFDDIAQEKLEKYRKLILPDFKQSQNRKQ
jgi:hypothetical protein